MFEQGQIVLVTGDWENNNTNGKLGVILDSWGSYYYIGFFNKLKMSNSNGGWYVDKYSDVKSTWWVRNYALKKAMTKNKFK